MSTFKIIQSKGTWQLEFSKDNIEIDNICEVIIEKEICEFIERARTVVPSNQWENRITKRKENKIYMTITSPFEKIKTLTQETLEGKDVKILGLGSSSTGSKQEVYYLVVACPKLQLARSNMGLGWKDFHITLGFLQNDIHQDIDKGPSSIIHDQFYLDQDQVIDCVHQHIALLSESPLLKHQMLLFCTNLLEKAFQPSPNYYATLAFVNYRLKKFEQAKGSAIAALELDHSHLEALIRYGDSCFKLEEFHESLWVLFLISCL